MRTPKFVYNEDGEKEISEECANCQYSYIEDIWYEWMCKKNECPYSIKENE